MQTEPTVPGHNRAAVPGDVILEIDDLRTVFNTEEGTIRAVDGVSMSIRKGRIMAVVGESGCGKSVTAYSVLKLIQKPGKIAGGRITFHPSSGDPVHITDLGDKDPMLYTIRGGYISMIFQEPMAALSPVHTIGNQVCEAILLHQEVSPEEAARLAEDMLGKVGIPNPEKRMAQYPHELSGGMRQRVVIAMALVCRPQFLIADEPTTALDVTIQAQILKLIKDLQADLGTAVMLITHDLGVVAQTADDVVVMYLGRAVESSPVEDLFARPRHPYTWSLLKSLPSISAAHSRLPAIAGSVPSLTAIPEGCPFHPRCPFAVAGTCDTGPPPRMRQLNDHQSVACYRAEEIEEELKC